MKIAITGSTGSLGGALIAALAHRTDVTRIVGLSRDEVKSGDLAERYADLPSLRCVLGDVRDERRLEEVFHGCDVVVHAAALKKITQSVYSPSELVATNVQGTINVIRAAITAGVKKVVFISSDKSPEATNLYGMTKAVAECYAVQSNSYATPRRCRVSAVRYGNVLLSRGSVVPFWRAQMARGVPLTITDPTMTRFLLTLPQAAAFVLQAIADMEGGETLVPMLPSATLDDLATAVAGLDYPRQIVGLRPGGEKRHEALLSREEPPRTYRIGERFTILPSHHSWRAAWRWPEEAQPVHGSYTSDAPVRRLSIDEIRALLSGEPR